jgi:hypothetical protein
MNLNLSLDEIENLLVQSMNGNATIFDNATIARILQKPTEELDFFRAENMIRIQALFSDFANQQTPAKRQRYLDSLGREEFEILVRTYYYIVTHSLLAARPTLH